MGLEELLIFLYLLKSMRIHLLILGNNVTGAGEVMLLELNVINAGRHESEAFIWLCVCTLISRVSGLLQ